MTTIDTQIVMPPATPEMDGTAAVRVERLVRMADDSEEPEDRTCPRCNGIGGDPMDDFCTPCDHCGGEGYEWWK